MFVIEWLSISRSCYRGTYSLSAASLACGIGMFKRYKSMHKETFDMVEQQIEDEKEPDHSVEVIINSMPR